MMRVLIVEDDLAIRLGLEDAFRSEGYDVSAVANGDDGEEQAFSHHWDLVILDVMLPGRSGLEILTHVRREGLQTPVILLTARGDEPDRVVGLDLGADDYVSKPFGVRELLARARALLRRGRTPSAPATPRRFDIGDAAIDLDAYQVLREGEVNAISPKEAAMLLLLKSHEGRAVPRERFLREVWGQDVIVGNRTVDTHMLNLRQKIERDPKRPVFLVTVHGVGYRLEPSPDA